MRFKQGSKVEILNNNDLPSGSWCCAEIVNGNRHYYNVKYDSCLGKTNEVIAERVLGKAVCPCPPRLADGKWMEGDIAEVLHVCSWKTAVVMKAISRDHYVVKFLGSSQEHRAHVSEIRMQQSWERENSVLIGKGCKSFKNVKFSKASNFNSERKGFQGPRNDMKRKLGTLDDLSAVQNNIDLHESRIASSKSMKRGSPYCSSLIEACKGHILKGGIVKNESRFHPVEEATEHGNVDGMAYPINHSKRYIHASFSNGKPGYCILDSENLTQYPLEVISESNGIDSDACSIGSCSTANETISKLPSHFLCDRDQDTQTLSSNAESYYELMYEEENCPCSPTEDYGEKIRLLELHAYRSTLEAFYASGSLSWEQEALLTNLRLSLHVSNDEHLVELRKLGSIRNISCKS